MFHVKHRPTPPEPAPSPAGACSTVHSSPARAAARLASAGTCRGSSPLPSPAASFVSTFLSSPVRAAIRSASAGTWPGSLPLPFPELRFDVLLLRASGRGSARWPWHVSGLVAPPLPRPEFRLVVLLLRATGRHSILFPRAGSLLNARSRARLERREGPTGVRPRKSGRTNRQVVGLPTCRAKGPVGDGGGMVRPRGWKHPEAGSDGHRSAATGTKCGLANAVSRSRCGVPVPTGLTDARLSRRSMFHVKHRIAMRALPGVGGGSR